MLRLKFVASLMVALLTLTAAPASAHSGITIEVTLAGTPYKTCTVNPGSGATGGDALDAAVASGCLLEWSHDSFAGFGRYVISIDYVNSAVATFWAVYVDGAFSDVGIDGMALQSGQVLTFDYQQWVVAL